MNDIGWPILIMVVLIGLLISGFHSAAEQEKEDKLKFMAACLQDNKQYQCDVLWGQTAESHRTEDMAKNAAIGFAAGAVAGSAGRR